MVLGIALILLSVLVLIVAGVVNVGSLPVISASDFDGLPGGWRFFSGRFRRRSVCCGNFRGGSFRNRHIHDRYLLDWSILGGYLRVWGFLHFASEPQKRAERTSKSSI